jgi:hypothetical protein
MRTFVSLAIALLFTLLTQPACSEDIAAQANSLLDPNPARRASATRALGDSHDPAAVAPLIQSLYWAPDKEQRDIIAALAALTGERFDSWFDWQVWEQGQPNLAPFAGYDAWLARALGRIDPAFQRFVHAGLTHRIRLEEIVWGGVRVDGIPALDRPRMTTVAAAGWLGDDDLVFGVAIGADVRAYPQRIVDWHEMVNDVVGGVPVSLAYCTLCGAAILFDARAEGRAPFAFASSGLLYRSNKLMYDRQTDSLWDQFTGEPVTGQLAGSGLRLAVLPLVTTSWRGWRRLHPETLVLSKQTGFARDYRPGAAYGAYVASNALLFPAAVADPAHQKQFAFGLLVPGGVKVWPLPRFDGGAVINDHVGLLDVVLIGDAGERTVRAYEARGHRFAPAERADQLRESHELWTITEAALVGPRGEKLRRLPGHLGYRFAWDGFFGVGVEGR